MMTGVRTVSEDDLPKVLASLDRGIPCALLCKKYGVGRGYMEQIRVTRRIPLLGESQYTEEGVKQLKANADRRRDYKKRRSQIAKKKALANESTRA